MVRAEEPVEALNHQTQQSAEEYEWWHYQGVLEEDICDCVLTQIFTQMENWTFIKISRNTCPVFPPSWPWHVLMPVFPREVCFSPSPAGPLKDAWLRQGTHGSDLRVWKHWGLSGSEWCGEWVSSAMEVIRQFLCSLGQPWIFVWSDFYITISPLDLINIAEAFVNMWLKYMVKEFKPFSIKIIEIISIVFLWGALQCLR